VCHRHLKSSTQKEEGTRVLLLLRSIIRPPAASVIISCLVSSSLASPPTPKSVRDSQDKVIEFPTIAPSIVMLHHHRATSSRGRSSPPTWHALLFLLLSAAMVVGGVAAVPDATHDGAERNEVFAAPRTSATPAASCPSDTMKCPDGITTVHRDPTTSCQFRPCPSPTSRVDDVVADENGVAAAAACTADAMLCPDGVTSVGRDPSNDCQFMPCPLVAAEDGDGVDGDEEGVACLADVKECTLPNENGTDVVYTYVSRDPRNNCTFYDCPPPKPPAAVDDGNGTVTVTTTLPITGDGDGDVSVAYQTTVTNSSDTTNAITTTSNNSTMTNTTINNNTVTVTNTMTNTTNITTEQDAKNVNFSDDERVRDDELPPSATASGTGSSSSSSSSIVEIATFNNFTKLVKALEVADLVKALDGDGIDDVDFVTVFAPTDDAFMNLPDGLFDLLLLPENLPQLTNLLLYHVVPGNASSSLLAGGGQLPTLLSGNDTTTDTLLVEPVDANGNIKVNDAFIVAEDVPASNGLIHAINAVLVPVGFAPATPAPTTTPSPTDAPDDDGGTSNEELCIGTGGSISNETCCGTATDFPNLCTDNVCPCPQGGNLKDRTVCVCPEGSCFHDMAGCITNETADRLELCTGTDGTVAFTSCCSATDNMPATCGIVGPCGCSPTDSSPRLVCDCPADECFSDSMGCVAETDMPTPLGGGDEPTGSPTSSLSPSVSAVPTGPVVPTAVPTAAPAAGGNVSIDELIADNTWMMIGPNRTRVRRPPGITSRQGISVFTSVVSSGSNIRNLFNPAGRFSSCYQAFAETSGELAVTCAASLLRQEIVSARATARIRALVQEIEAAGEPNVVVLQDLVRLQQNATILTTLQVQDWFAGVETACACQADEVVMDMYDILRKELRRRCLIYQVFMHVDEDATLPAMVNTTEGLAGGFRLTRRERFHVTLVKKGVGTMWQNGRAINYANFENLPADGYALQNSALSVDVKMNGATYRVVNTQLSPVEDVHKGEAAELVAYLSRDGDEDSSAGFQTVVAGNIPPAAATVLSDAGYIDTWLDNTNADEDPPSEAYTGGTDIDIRERIRNLDKREDVIMIKDGLDRWQSNNDMRVSPWLRRFGRGGARGKILGRPRFWFSTNMCIYGELYPRMKTENVFSRAEL